MRFSQCLTEFALKIYRYWYFSIHTDYVRKLQFFAYTPYKNAYLWVPAGFFRWLVPLCFPAPGRPGAEVPDYTGIPL